MNSLTKRLVTLAVAVSTLGGASLIVGLGALPAGAATTITFGTPPGVQPACASASCVAGQPLSTEPVALLAGNSATASVTLSIASGPGTLHCTTNPAVATGIGGTASWGTCTINQAGTYTLQADDTTDGVVSAPSSTFTVDQPHLVFSHQPVNPSVAGDNNGVQVSLENSSNVVVPTGNADSIQLTIASGPGTLNCGTRNLVGGVADFSSGVCDINLAGTYTLAANDITDSNVSGAVSNAFAVNPNIPNQLAVVNSPALNSNIGLNADFPVSVAVEDTFGNIITTTPASTTVHLAITPLTGTPGAALNCPTYVGNTAAVTPGTGEATFVDGCSIDTAGSGYTLTATSSPYTAATSAAFDIATAPPTVTTLAANAIDGTDATVNGSINDEGVATSYFFDYSTSPSLASPTATTTHALAASGGAQPVSAVIAGLTPGTTYYFALVTTTDGSGGILSVTTGVVTTLAATLVTGNSATLNGTVNDEDVATGYFFEYGTSSTLASPTVTTTTPLAAASSAQSVSTAITGLTAGTTYYFELVTTTDGSGGILNFANGLVTTGAATLVTGNSATLNGTVNDQSVATSYNFEYSTSSSLASPVSTTVAPLPALGNAQVVSAAITGLTSGTTYYFELVTTSAGSGSILSFTAGGGTPLPVQIYGTDAIGTALAVSQAEFHTVHSAGGVVLARDDFFSDSLAGGPLAAAINGPLLITPGASISSSLDPRVLAEIQRVLPPAGTVYILGGNQALNPGIDTALQAAGFNTIREAGADAYATAVGIANAIAGTTWGTPGTVFEATGLSFYDALSAVPAAIKQHAAILLTNGSSQNPSTAAYLAAHPGDTRYTVGGSLAAGGADPSGFNISGVDLFNTSAAVASHFFPTASIFGVATAADFPDALGGGVYMATNGRSGPILLVNQSAPLPAEIVPYLGTLAVGTQGYVFGGPLAIGPTVLSALQAAVGG